MTTITMTTSLGLVDESRPSQDATLGAWLFLAACFLSPLALGLGVWTLGVACLLQVALAALALAALGRCGWRLARRALASEEAGELKAWTARKARAAAAWWEALPALKKAGLVYASLAAPALLVSLAIFAGLAGVLGALALALAAWYAVSCREELWSALTLDFDPEVRRLVLGLYAGCALAFLLAGLAGLAASSPLALEVLAALATASSALACAWGLAYLVYRASLHADPLVGRVAKKAGRALLAVALALAMIALAPALFLLAVLAFALLGALAPAFRAGGRLALRALAVLALPVALPALALALTLQGLWLAALALWRARKEAKKEAALRPAASLPGGVGALGCCVEQAAACVHALVALLAVGAAALLVWHDPTWLVLPGALLALLLAREGLGRLQDLVEARPARKGRRPA